MVKKKKSEQIHFCTAESKSKEKAHHSKNCYMITRTEGETPNNLSVTDFLLEYIVLADLIELELIQKTK